MDNYFSSTPIYRIWIDILDYLSPRTSFLIDDFHFQFVSFVCERDEVVYTYKNEQYKIRFVYAQESRRFYCSVLQAESDELIQSPLLAPKQLAPFSNIQDLQNEIDLWLQFLKIQLLPLLVARPKGR